MARGTYPDGVPEEFLIPEAVARTARRLPEVPRRSPASCGITGGTTRAAVVVDDLDGDGVLDIVDLEQRVPTRRSSVPRQGRRHVRGRRGPSRPQGASSAGSTSSATDYDNDGDIDLSRPARRLAAGRGAHPQVAAAQRRRRHLHRRDARGGPREAGFPDAGRRLVRLRQRRRPRPLRRQRVADRPDAVKARARPTPTIPRSLFRNDGDGTFTDVAAQAGVTNDRYCKGAAAGDYDDDGWIDLYVSNIGREPALPQQRRRHVHGRRAEARRDRAGRRQLRDLVLRLRQRRRPRHLRRRLRRRDRRPRGVATSGSRSTRSAPRLYRNKGDGTFEDVDADVASSGGRWRRWARTSATSTTTAGSTSTWHGLARLRRAHAERDAPERRRARTSSTSPSAGGFGHLQKGHGVAFADLDHDGDQDVFNELGGFYRGRRVLQLALREPGQREPLPHAQARGHGARTASPTARASRSS